MNILFLLNIGFEVPGPSVHLFDNIISNILRNGHNIHLIERLSSKNNVIPDSFTEYVGRNYTYNSITMKPSPKNNFILRYLTDIKYALKCAGYYRKLKNTDIVFLQSCNFALFPILFVKFFIKSKIIYNVQDIFPINGLYLGIFKSKSFIYKILRALQKKAYQLSDKIITISEDMKNTLINEGIDKDKISVIHNWGDAEDFDPIKEKDNAFIKKYNIDTDKMKIVYAGNTGMAQNVEIIIKCASKFVANDNIHFYIIGNGSESERLKKSAEGLKNITFIPSQPMETALEVYSMADVNMITLADNIVYSALPSKTANCLLAGKPIIACINKNSCYADMLSESEYIRIVGCNDVISLAENISGLYEIIKNGDKSDHIKMSLNNVCKKYFSTDNIDKYLLEIEKLYNYGK